MVFTIQRIIFIALALVVAVSATSLRLGVRQPGDGLVCVGDVNLKGLYGKVVSAQRICNVPRWNQNITQILALDLGKPGYGGYASVVKGGVGQRNVTLYLWSQKSQALNFTIQVFARPYY